MKSVRSNDVIQQSYFCLICTLGYPWKFQILYFLTDLVEIWPIIRVFGADSKSEVTFQIKGQCQANIGNFWAIFASKLATDTPQ